MNDREKQILYTIIAHYIKTGESVGSRTIEKKYDVGVSSATIRNTMADLEDKGLIEKVHTSSGRVPTKDGYKKYIDDIMPYISCDEYSDCFDSFEGLKSKQLSSIIKAITELVAKSSNSTVITLEPSLEKNRLKKVEMVYVNENRVFIVAITESGVVRTANLILKNYTTEYTIKKLSEYINNIIKENGYSLVELKQVLLNIGSLDEGFESDNTTKLHIANETSLLLHLENLESSLKFIEDKENFKNILKSIIENDKFSTYEVNVLFGADLGIKELENLSLIFTKFEYENELGAICIVGSTRMDYKENIAKLQYVNEILIKSLSYMQGIKLLG
ncbi:heat-inducible transcriptional repressor HrcA [Oceanivirga miroungae]|uniref:Heat-inducible transcription repressor HrcA n=1 Tax=Oceanivirga miroungae TaxID=1130046 RepID=A0A6I8MC46_9FUSO|nr:heat-inducible transcriptional repressor HrcA [Oceanivirga miroungae]VWL85820.1 heat-inducible transcription repressor HrcA [Oceanivirga miroungae]